MTADVAVWKPDEHRHSIWQIIDHIAAAKEEVIARLEDRTPERYAWPELSGDDAAWQQLLRKLEETHGRLMDAIDRVPEDRLVWSEVPGWDPVVQSRT